MDKPFILQFLEVMDARYQLDYKSKGRLKREKIGYSGHMQFDEMIKPLIPDKWEVIHDISFELNYGRTQIDTLLIAPHGFYHFEVKNLLSNYEYTEGEWRNSSGKMMRNFFTQLTRQNEILNGLMFDFGIKAPLKSKLVLINEDDTVKFFEDKSSEYLKRGHIRSYMKEIKLTNQVLISPKEVAKRLKQQSVPSYKDIKIEEKNLVKDVMTGILCENCESNMIDKSRRFHLQCIKCGASEPKERAMIRTICDLGILYYDQPLTRKMVMDFLGDEALEHNAKRVLKKYFMMVPGGKLTSYVNPVNQMAYAFPDLVFRYRC